MLGVLSWTCTQNKTMPVGVSWDCLEDQAPVTIKDPFFPQEMIQMKLTMWKESKYSKHLSPLPSNWTRAVLCGQQHTRWLVYFVCLEIACCFWWWEQRWGSGTGTTVPQPAALHQIIQKMTLLKKNFCGTEVCVCSPKVCFVPALALMQGCLLFVAVNILANHFYFGMEIIP